jgi:uncharacterized protein YdiU (UPF0061 family)
LKSEPQYTHKLRSWWQAFPSITLDNDSITCCHDSAIYLSPFLNNLHFSNSFAALGEGFYAPVAPTALHTSAHLVHFNHDVGALLSLPEGIHQDPQFVDIFTGNRPLQGGNPLAINPKYILRNYMAQTAIEKVQRDNDYSEIDRLMTVLKMPFDEHPEHAHYAEAPPAWAADLSVSCSS